MPTTYSAPLTYSIVSTEGYVYPLPEPQTARWSYTIVSDPSPSGTVRRSFYATVEWHWSGELRDALTDAQYQLFRNCRLADGSINFITRDNSNPPQFRAFRGKTHARVGAARAYGAWFGVSVNFWLVEPTLVTLYYPPGTASVHTGSTNLNTASSFLSLSTGTFKARYYVGRTAASLTPSEAGLTLPVTLTATLTASATFAGPPIYTLSGSGNVPIPSGSGVGFIFTAASNVLSGSGSIPAPSGSGVGLHTAAPGAGFIFYGTANAQVATSSGAGIHVSGPSVYTLSGGGNVPVPSGSGVGLVTTPNARTLSGSRTAATPVGSGAGILITNPTGGAHTATTWGILVDRTVPAGVTVAPPSGSGTAQIITLTIATSDAYPVGYTMRIWGSVDNTYDTNVQTTQGASTPIAYATGYTVKVSAGAGVKTLNLIVYDAAGNPSTTATTTYTLT